MRRDLILKKSGSRCWYCGASLDGKKWHADHFDPVYRGRGEDGEHGYPERDVDSNLVPACAPCNLFKSVYTLEAFRQQIQAQVDRARKSSVNFRTAERFGLIEVKTNPVVFWFEAHQKLNGG